MRIGGLAAEKSSMFKSQEKFGAQSFIRYVGSGKEGEISVMLYSN